MTKNQIRTLRELMRDRQVVSWALYDWANSAFATTIMAGFFPVFFKQFWSAGTDVNLSTYQLGWANSLASGILAFLSPILGAIADQGSQRKKLLVVFSALGIVMTGSLSLVERGHWEMAVLLYVIASIGFAGANSFYDAMIISVSPPRELSRISTLGFSAGYLGGGLLFALNVAMTLKPHLFGLASAAQAVRLSFVSVAIWWAVFTLPLLLFVKEERDPGVRKQWWQLALLGGKQVLTTFKEIRQLKNAAIFLVAYFFYIDGVNTIIRMAVDYGLALGFPSDSLIVALLITQFVGFPAAILYGMFAHRIGDRAGIFVAIALYCGVTMYAYFMKSPAQFYVLAGVIGLVQGGIQSLSRSVFASMIPAAKAGEYFGFFNMLGKFSSMMGPALIGYVSVATQDSRLSVLSLLLLFAVGAITLLFVNFNSPEKLLTES